MRRGPDRCSARAREERSSRRVAQLDPGGSSAGPHRSGILRSGLDGILSRRLRPTGARYHEKRLPMRLPRSIVASDARLSPSPSPWARCPSEAQPTRGPPSFARSSPPRRTSSRIPQRTASTRSVSSHSRQNPVGSSTSTRRPGSPSAPPGEIARPRAGVCELYGDLLERAFIAWVASRAQIDGGPRVSFVGESVGGVGPPSGQPCSAATE